MKNKLFALVALILALSLVVAPALQAGLTVTFVRTIGDTDDDYRIRDFTVAFDSSYATGGESLSAANMALSSVHSVTCEDEDGYTAQYDYTNSKLLMYAADNRYGPADISGVTVGTPALTHNADPATNLSAAALYCLESYGAGGMNICQLSSTTASNADVLGSTDDVSGIAGAATPRFWVNDSDSPSGVQIYINESSSDQLEMVSPTAQDAYIIMPFEAIADAIPGFSYAVKVNHNASAADGKALFFDDNGAVDAQLAFVDTGGAGGVIPAGDIEVLAPDYMSVSDAGTLKQVTNGVDLSGVTELRCRATGK